MKVTRRKASCCSRDDDLLDLDVAQGSHLVGPSRFIVRYLAKTAGSILRAGARARISNLVRDSRLGIQPTLNLIKSRI